jgi:hypothetical protein
MGDSGGRLNSQSQQTEPDAKLFAVQKTPQRRQSAIGFDVEGDVGRGSEWAAHQHSSEADDVHLAQTDLMETAGRGSPQTGDAMFYINQQ